MSDKVGKPRIGKGWADYHEALYGARNHPENQDKTRGLPRRLKAEC
jgi:hypothetical protein